MSNFFRKIPKFVFVKLNEFNLKLKNKNMSFVGKSKILSALVFATMAVIIVITLILHHQTTVTALEQKKEEQLIVSQTQHLSSELSDISVKISDVQKQLQSGDNQDIEEVKKTLLSLSSQVKTIADDSNTIIEKAIEVNTTKLQQQLGSIQTQLVEIKDHKNKINIVDPDQLGFKVVDIFNMDHEDIVSIHYGAHTVPLIEGETIAGWSLVSASFATQRAEFMNEKNQHVIINLNSTQS